jgi:hypothetical protein
MEIAIRRVDDPWPDNSYVPKIDPKTKILQVRQQREVTVNVRTDMLTWLHARGHIAEHQYLAGKRFCGLLEREGIAGARAVDPTREPVDGNPPRGEPLVRSMEAAELLSEAQSTVGSRAYSWLRHMLIADPGETISGYEQANWRRRKRTNGRLRKCLDRLARLWKFAG